MIRVLLVVAPLRDPQLYPDIKPGILEAPPLNLGYIASLLMGQGFDVSIVDMRVEKIGLDQLARMVEDERFDIVGISTTTATYPNGLRIGKRVKEVRSGTLVVIGGYHVTFTAEDCLTKNPFIDVVVRGEGEFTMLELAKAWRTGGTLAHIAGLSHRNQGMGEVIHNPARPFISDLDSLPLPARQLMPVRAYDLKGALLSSRGCPHRCIFCSASAMSGGRYRIRSADRVLDEIELLVGDYGFHHLSMLDDTFTALPRQLTFPVCEGIVQRGFKVSFDCESRVDVFTPELADALVRAGCVSIQFGVESGSQEILNATRKGITLKQVRNAVRWASAAGIRVACSFVLGQVNDTVETIRQTFDFWLELKDLGATLIGFGPLTPFPGSDVYENREKYGIVIHESDWSMFTTLGPVISTRYLTRDQLRDLCLEGYSILEREGLSLSKVRRREWQANCSNFSTPFPPMT